MNKLTDELIFNIILPRMFNAVGLNNVDIKEYIKIPNWYWTKTWDITQSDGFESWLVNILRKSCRMNKKQAKIIAYQFVSIYGWKLNDDK